MSNLKFSQFGIDKKEQNQKKKENKRNYANDEEIDDINVVSEEYSENYSEEYSLVDSLNSIKEFGIEDIFNLFKKINKICYELISLFVIDCKSYEEIAENYINFKRYSYEYLKRKKYLCLEKLKDFTNEHYLKLGL